MIHALPTQYVEAPSRTDLDLAIGVLVGRLRCTREQAFGEIASAVRDNGGGLLQLSVGLVELASGEKTVDELPAEVVARWGDLFVD